MASDASARMAPAAFVALLLFPIAHAAPLELSDPVVVLAAAVAETENGFVGSTATITITSARNGSGHVFLDTFPLAAVDMQGSARLATRVAAQLTGQDLDTRDVFFVVRSSAEQIGGPSAGAAMTVGAIASLNGWKVRDDVLMTGTISPDATVGPVGGIVEKAAAAASVGITRFLYPSGQEIVPSGDGLVNVTQYCRLELGIECIPIADVVEAVGLMTDHEIRRPPLVGNVTGEDFMARLAPLSGTLVTDAERLYNEAAATVVDVPDGATKTLLMEQLEIGRSLLERARNDTSNDTYYRAASISFQSSIRSHYVTSASGYLIASDRIAYLAGTLARTREAVAAAYAAVSANDVRDTNSFEAVGAAQVRALEAEQLIARATRNAANASSIDDILRPFDGGVMYDAAFAAERAKTAEWWLQLAEGFPPGEPVDKDALEEIARDTITTSREEVAYVEAVFQQAGTEGTFGTSRELLAEAATSVERQFYAAAMLQALEASVRASVLLEIAGYGGTVPPSKFETAREGAARAIQGARARGVESLLAQSAYEFGISLEDPIEKLTFLGVARMTGNIAGLPGLFSEAAPQIDVRFQGGPFTYRVDVVYIAAAFAVGLALGAGAGLTALMPRTSAEPDFPSGSTLTSPTPESIPSSGDSVANSIERSRTSGLGGRDGP